MVGKFAYSGRGVVVRISPEKYREHEVCTDLTVPVYLFFSDDIHQIEQKISIDNQVVFPLYPFHSIIVSGSALLDIEYNSPNQVYAVLVSENKLLNRGDEILGQGNELLGQGNDILSQGDDILGQGNDILGQGNDILGQGDDILGQVDELLGQGNEILGQGNELLGQGNDILGQENDSPRQENGLPRQENEYSHREDERQKAVNDLFFSIKQSNIPSKHPHRSYALYWHFTKAKSIYEGDSILH